MAYPCIKGFGECTACGYCEEPEDDLDEDKYDFKNEYRPEDDWDEEF